MSTPSHGVGEMVLGFGKHIGKPFKDVPEGYVAWMSRPYNRSAWIYQKGVNWTELAREELRRREAEGVPLEVLTKDQGWDQGTPPPQDEEWRNQKAGLTGAGPVGPVGPIGLVGPVAGTGMPFQNAFSTPAALEAEHEVVASPTQGVLAPPKAELQEVYIEVTLQAVDDAVDLLMRKYLTRLNKEQHFLEWLVTLVDEAIRYGEREPNLMGSMYLGFDFDWRLTGGRNVVLYHVTKKVADAQRDSESSSGPSDADADGSAAARAVSDLFFAVTGQR